MVSGMTLTGSVACMTSSNQWSGSTYVNIAVSEDAQTISVSAGGNIHSCMNLYVGGSSPNGIYPLIGYSASGLQYRTYIPIGIGGYNTIYLTNSGFNGAIGYISTATSGVYN